MQESTFGGTNLSVWSWSCRKWLCVCVSVSPHFTYINLLNKFKWRFISEKYTESFRVNLISVHIGPVWSQDISVSVLTWLLVERPEFFPSGAAFPSSPPRPDRIRGTPNLPYNMDRDFSTGIKRLEREADHSRSSSIEVKNALRYINATQ